VILIGLGLVFLLDRLDIFHGRLLEFAWPVLLIGVGVWMIVRRLGDSQGGSK
jgi:ABC-type nickel/cobalt efflux system permease component RcnA